MGEIGFYLFGRLVAYYGLMITAGVLAAAGLASVQLKRFHLAAEDMIILCAVSVLFGIIGAKALYIVVSWEQIDPARLTEWAYIGALARGGFVFLGGLIGGLAGVLLCRRRLKISVQPYIQACMGCIPTAHGFGRIGCYLVGCCYGIPYTGPLSVVYTRSRFAPNGVGLFPVQMVEALIELALGGCLLLLSRRLKGNASLFLYLLVYAPVRFCLEFLRYDAARGVWAGLSTSQLLCIPIFVLSLLWFAKETKTQPG